MSPATVSAKTVSRLPFPGSAITYTIVLSNGAATPQQDNPGDELSDVLPASCAGWTGRLAAGAAAPVT